MAEPHIDVATVRRLAREQRVVAHPTRYHASKHGFGFIACATALEHCYAVKVDPLRQRAWYALASHTHDRTLRVDFDAVEDEDGALLLVVTAYHV